MNRVDHDLGDDDAGAPGARFFPIGFGLGAVAALALFFGYRAVAPDEAGSAPAPRATSADTTEGVSAVAAPDPLPADEPSAFGPPAPVAVSSGVAPEDAYAVAAPDVAAAAGPDLDGLEALASLNAGTSARSDGDALGPRTFVTGTRLPGIGDPESANLFGGPVMMVSSSVPRVIVLADGTSLVPGGTLPGGHRIVDIRRERILLERDGIEWRVQIP